jgi:hypothetical protein
MFNSSMGVLLLLLHTFRLVLDPADAAALGGDDSMLSAMPYVLVLTAVTV